MPDSVRCVAKTSISIVTVSLNQRKYLPDCLDSVASQNAAPLEHIVVDPGSTDGSRELLSGVRYPNVRLVFEADDGPADGLNRGFARAEGEILGYLNADDCYLPGILRQVQDTFRARPEIDVLCGHGWQIDAAGRRLHRIYSTPFKKRWVRYGHFNVVQQATFFRRSAFERTAGFNPQNRTCWDGELIADLYLSGARFAIVDADWGGFRLYPESISGSGRLERQYRRDKERILAKLLGREVSHLDRLTRTVVRVEKGIRTRMAQGRS